MIARTFAWFVLVSLAFCGTLVGCGGGPDIDAEFASVSGKVKYDDGSVPQGQIRVIRFDPVADASAPKIRKAASAQISKEDGSFEMYTVRPGDGVILGKYKVVFIIQQSHEDPAPQVAAQFTSAETTPLEVDVQEDLAELEYVIQRP